MLQVFNPSWWSLKEEKEETQNEKEIINYKHELDMLAIDLHSCIYVSDDYIIRREKKIIHNMKAAKLNYYKANEYDNVNWRYIFKLDTQNNLIIEKVG